MFDPNQPPVNRYEDMWQKSPRLHTQMYMTCTACGSFTCEYTQAVVVGARGAYQVYACSPQCEERGKRRAREAAVVHDAQDADAAVIAAAAGTALPGAEGA